MVKHKPEIEDYNMTSRKKFIPEANLRKILKHPNHPRIDNIESEPKTDFADGSGFLSELRALDQQVGDAIKASVPNMG
ncbi:unnamed protein product [marine sediment metagenome]|uniref:Uncharacterized protein n=1 Tax=marine sediment metagenome TaxID=412755 RepID=X0YPH1_9ZZZZ